MYLGIDLGTSSRCRGWTSELGREILAGKHALADLGEFVHSQGIDPRATSGSQDQLVSLVRSYR